MGRFYSPFPHRLAALRLAILISAFIASGYLLLAIVCYEATTPYVHDTPIFMAVGRALLNGRELYSQVFETKPPGIFVLAAMSLAMHDHWPRLFDTTSLFRILQLCAYVVLLAACFVPRLPGCANSQNRIHRFLFGVVMVVMTAAFAGQGTPESFGAAFGAAYVTAFVRLDGSITWRHSIGLGILLAIAIGFKEPFVVSLVAASLVCSRHGLHSLKAVALSLVAASVFGIACLSLAGWLDDYILSYIPYMITERIPSHMRRAFWKEIVDVRWVFGSTALLSPFFPVLLFGLVAGAGGVAGGLRVKALRIVALAVALILTMIAIRVGGVLAAQYIVFAVPVLMALDFEALRLSTEHRKSWLVNLLTTVLIFVILTMPFGRHSDRTVDITKIGSSPLREELMKQDIQARRDAMMFDGIIEECGYIASTVLRPIDSYFYSYSKHSPVGKDYLWRSPYMNEDAGVAAAIVEGLTESQIVVFEIDEQGLRQFKDVERFVAVHFVEKPPLCALGHVPSEVKILFRDEPTRDQKNERLEMLGDKYLAEGRAHDALQAFMDAGRYSKANEIGEFFRRNGRMEAAIEVFEATAAHAHLLALGDSCLRDGCFEVSLRAFLAANDPNRLMKLINMLNGVTDENAKRLREKALTLVSKMQSDRDPTSNRK